MSISGKNSDIINAARQVIQDLVKDVEKGEVYDGKVVKIMILAPLSNYCLVKKPCFIFQKLPKSVLKKLKITLVLVTQLK